MSKQEENVITGADVNARGDSDISTDDISPSDTSPKPTPVMVAIWYEVAAVVILVVLSALGFFSVRQARFAESVVFSVIVFAMMLVIFIFDPHRGQTPNSKTASVTGLLSALAGVVSATIGVNFSTQAEDTSDYETVVKSLFATISGWTYTTAILLVAVLVLSFGFQMARRNRENLIASISAMVGLGVSGISAAGWVLAPVLLHNLFQVGVLGRDFLHPFILIIVAAIFVASLVGMVFASVVWMRNMRRRLSIHETIGIVTIPVLMMGGLIPVLSAFAMWLISL